MKTPKKLHISSERSVPILGQGTWGMGENAFKSSQEIEALRKGIDLGMSLIDTAEMYGNGATEELVGEALLNCRKEAFIVTKVLPQHATRLGTIEACERSLQRLKTDYIDLYLLHWRGVIPLEETFAAFKSLKKAGKILDFGVSNFDVTDMEEVITLSDEIVTNQVLYNLHTRGIEWDLIPWCQEHRISVMAYTPFGQDGKLLHHPLLKKIAARYSASSTQVALAWVFLQKGMIAIPKAGSVEHVVENHGALALKLTEEDLRELDQAFPPPTRKIPLKTL